MLVLLQHPLFLGRRQSGRPEHGESERTGGYIEDVARKSAPHRKKKPKLGTGARFKKLAKKVGSPALAAFIGRKKYGPKRFAQLSAAGRRRRG